MVETTVRGTDLSGLVGMLREQADVKYDVVVPATKIRSVDGVIRIEGGAVRFTDDGATEADAALAPTDVFDDGISDKLGIPRAYVRRMRESRPDLYDANVNGWLHGAQRGLGAALVDRLPMDYPADARSFLVRGFRTDDPDSTGIARALLSPNFKPIDNLDMLLAALEAMRTAGVDVEIESADLSERKMSVKVVAPHITALAPVLLRNYRRPWGPGEAPWETTRGRAHGWLAPGYQPVVFAGYEIGNSETGGSAFTITPRLMVKVCRNGLVVKADALRSVHLGARLDDGLIRWSGETRQRSVELVKSQVTDAVRTFLDVDYITKVIERVEESSTVKVAEPVQAIQRLQKAQGWTQSEADDILAHWLRSGDQTAGGVMQAVTSVAQEVPSPDRASDLEASALDVLAAAAALTN